LTQRFSGDARASEATGESRARERSYGGDFLLEGDVFIFLDDNLKFMNHLDDSLS